MRLVVSSTIFLVVGLINFIIWGVLLGGGDYHQYLAKHTWYLPLSLTIALAFLGFLGPRIVPRMLLAILGVMMIVSEFLYWYWMFSS